MTDQIRTNPDGSIDTAFYMARGRHMRSQQAHNLAGKTTRSLARGLVTGAVVVLALAVLPVMF